MVAYRQPFLIPSMTEVGRGPRAPEPANPMIHPSKFVFHHHAFADNSSKLAHRFLWVSPTICIK
jgi:hypothetical protein